MLNAGYRSGAMARRMGGPRMTTLEAFPVYAPKALAGIGELPDTVADRAIRIRLDRRIREEPIERFRRRETQETAEPLHQGLVAWGEHHLERLVDARPALPDELDDRAQDGWEPLLAIADLAGDAWPERARSAALALSGPEARKDEDASLTARLLADIHYVFSENGAERYRTADLIDKLCEIEESPWGDWYGKTITAQGVSKLLRPFRIRTMPVKVEGVTVRGYKVEQFSDAFHRVLGVTGVTGVTPGSESQNEVTKSNAVTPSPNQRVTDDAAPQAAGNASNAGNAQHTGERAPVPGDPDFPDLVDDRFHAGHLTEAEWLSRRKLHAALVGAPA
jgi:hypothetical protein